MEFDCLARLPAAVGGLCLLGGGRCRDLEGRVKGMWLAEGEQGELGRSRAEDRGRRLEGTDWEGQ